MVFVRCRGNRLCVCWRGDAFALIRENFRATFTRHGQATWSSREQAWSLPLSERARLERWLTTLFDSDAISWR